MKSHPYQNHIIMVQYAQITNAKYREIFACIVRFSQNAEMLKINLKNHLTAQYDGAIIGDDERRKSAEKFQIKNQSEKQYLNTMS